MLVNTNTKIYNLMQQGKTGEQIKDKNNNEYPDEQTNNQSYAFQKQNQFLGKTIVKNIAELLRIF